MFVRNPWNSLLFAVLVAGASLPQVAAAQHISGDSPIDEVDEHTNEQAADGSWLVVESGDACLEHASLLSSITTWLGTPTTTRNVLVHLDSGAVSFVVYEADLVLGERSFSTLPTDCADRRAALSLAIAIALDREVLSRIGVVDAPVDPPIAPAPTEPAPEPQDGPVVEAPRAPLTSSVALRLVAGYGVLPAWSGGLELGASVGRRNWSVRLSLWATAPQTLALGAGDVGLQAYGGVIAACRHQQSSVVAFFGCAGLAGGLWMGEGEGFIMSSTESAGFFDALADVGVRIPAHSAVAFSAGLRARVPILQPSFSARHENGMPMASVQGASVSAEGWLGIDFRFL